MHAASAERPDGGSHDGAEHLLDLVLSRLPAIVWTADAGLRITLVEGSELASVGLTPGDLVGLTIDEIFEATQDVTARDAHRQALAGEVATYVHTWLLRTYEVNVQPRRDDVGEIVGVIGVAIDVTERAKLAEELHTALERHEHVQRATRDAIWDWDLRSGEVEWGPGLTTFGYLPSDANSAGWWRSHLHPDDRNRVLDSLRELFDGGDDTWVSGFRFQRADCSYAEVIDRGHIIRDADGSAVRAIGSMTDVSDMKRTQDALRESEARFRALVMNASDAILVTDEDATITYVSPGAQEIIGHPPASLVGKVSFDFVHPDDTDHAISGYLTALAEPGVVHSLRARVVHRLGTARHVDVRIVNLLQDPAVRGVVVNTRDVTEQVEAEIERGRLATELAKVRRLESIGQLAAGVAHDFNNLLGAILNYTHLVATELGASHPAQTDLAEIRHAAERGATLTKQLLIFGRRDAGTPSVVSLNEVIEGVRALLTASVGDAIDLEFRLDQQIGAVRADRHQLEQVLMNLTLNARDAMAEGGTLTISTDDRAPVAATDGAPVPGRWVCLAVSDRGSGMTPEVRERLFEPFFTTKPVGSGTGLGLATVYGIVEQANGTIAVESQPGAGTTFRVHLPATDESPQPPPTHEAPARAAGRGRRVLVVEDERRLRETIGRVLEDAGFVARLADGSTSALQMLRSDEALDALITDLAMPEVGGTELVERARVLRPGIAVVLMSGHEPSVDNGHPLLRKPFTPGSLVSALDRALA